MSLYATGTIAASDVSASLKCRGLSPFLVLQAIEELQRIRQSQQGSKAPDQPATVHTTAATDTSQQPSAEDAHPSRKRARDASTPAPASDTNADTAGDKNPYATVYDNGDSYTKLRPGAFEMLEALRNCCELRIFTMGNPQYACAMASLLDKSGALFRNRIVARDDADPAWRFKGLQKVGAMPTLTAIIDDTVGALLPSRSPEPLTTFPLRAQRTAAPGAAHVRGSRFLASVTVSPGRFAQVATPGTCMLCTCDPLQQTM